MNIPKIETILQCAGGMMEQARVSGKSLSKHDRDYIAEARSIAKAQGLSEGIITAYLREGAELIRQHLPV